MSRCTRRVRVCAPPHLHTRPPARTPACVRERFIWTFWTDARFSFEFNDLRRPDTPSRSFDNLDVVPTQRTAKQARTPANGQALVTKTALQAHVFIKTVPPCLAASMTPHAQAQTCLQRLVQA